MAISGMFVIILVTLTGKKSRQLGIQVVCTIRIAQFIIMKIYH